MKTGHIVLSKDIEYLAEQVSTVVKPAAPDTFAQQVSQQARKILQRGQPSDAETFLRALGEVPGESPVEIIEPDDEADVEIIDEPEDQPQIQQIPRPDIEQTDSGLISEEDEEKFISYLRDVFKAAREEQTQELRQPEPNEMYLAQLTQLIHLVDQLEDMYAKPGVLSKSQHIENERRLDGRLERMFAYKPKRQEATAEPEPETEPEPEAAVQEPEPQPEVAEPAPEATPASERSELGQFTSARDRDQIASLVYRKNFRELTPEDEAALQGLSQQDWVSGRRYFAKLRNRINRLLRAGPEEQTPDDRQFLQDMRGRFPKLFATQEELLNDPVLRVLYEAATAEQGGRIELLQNGKWMRVWPYADDRSFYFDLLAPEGGWEQTGLVTPQAGDETDITTAVTPPEAPAAEPEAQPAPQQQQQQPEGPQLSDNDRAIVDKIKAAIGEATPGTPEQNQEAIKNLRQMWREATQIEDNKTRLAMLRELRTALSELRTSTQAGDPEGTIGTETDQFLVQLRNRAKQYRTGLAWWSFGLNRMINKLIGSGARAVKSREGKGGTEYKIMSPAIEKPVFFWVPAEQTESRVKLDGFIEDILAEQEMPVRLDPKGEAPDAAFGMPPEPPGGDPVGGTGEEAQPSLPGEEQPQQEEPDTPKIPSRVLVTQNGKWWVMSWENWLQFLVQGASGARWNLDHWGARVPEGKPNDVRQFVTMDEGPPKYYSTDPGTNVYYVQGWEPRRFKQELDYIQSMDVAGMSLVEPTPPSEEPTILSTR